MKDCIIIDPTDENGRFYLIMGEKPGCEDCAHFVLASLPGWMFDDFIAHKEAHESEAEDISAAMAIHGRDAETNKKPGMQSESADTAGFQVYEKKSMLNHGQVVLEYGKLPTSLRLKAYLMPTSTGQKVVYMCERTNEFKERYPTCKLFIGSSDEVRTSKLAASQQKQLWPGHSMLALMGMGKRSGEISNDW